MAVGCSGQVVGNGHCDLGVGAWVGKILSTPNIDGQGRLEYGIDVGHKETRVDWSILTETRRFLVTDGLLDVLSTEHAEMTTEQVPITSEIFATFIACPTLTAIRIRLNGLS